MTKEDISKLPNLPDVVEQVLQEETERLSQLMMPSLVIEKCPFLFLKSDGTDGS